MAGREIGIRRFATILGFLALSAFMAAGAWWIALTGALDRLEERGRSDLALASDRLTGQLQRYREIVVLTASHPLVLGLAVNPATPPHLAQRLLQRTADLTASDEFLLAGPDGQVLASSLGRDDGMEMSGDPGFRRGLQGALGMSHGTEPTGGRFFSYSAPVFDGPGPAVAVLTVRVHSEVIETAWRGEPMVVFFTDDQDIIFISSRDELLAPSQSNLAIGMAYSASEQIAPGPGRVSHELLADLIGSQTGHVLWRLDGGPYLPSEALLLSRPLPVIGMVGRALVDVAPARQQARLIALLTVALCMMAAAIVYALQERRRTLAVRLAAEAAANARLEMRVAERTSALHEANLRLHRAQSDLVQAGKLSALGQMSAGISHELNQPLMAIRSYAENAGLFLGRDQPQRAAENLGQISELARRMGRIIKNLRAFARNESEPINDVDLVHVIEAALELSQARLTECGIALEWAAPTAPVMVRGGEVRLQQVVLNLLSNATDAMVDLPERRITIAIDEVPGLVRLIIRDTGPGIAEPERIFDPFYTTKEVGRSEGMGLGLSISYGLVQSFGGAIRGRNLPDGGAEFTVELSRVEPAQKEAGVA